MVGCYHILYTSTEEAAIVYCLLPESKLLFVMYTSREEAYTYISREWTASFYYLILESRLLL